LSADLRARDDALAAQSALLAKLDEIGQARRRRWRSVTQFSSWLTHPSRTRLSFVKQYVALRRSDEFDPSYYLSHYPDVAHAGLNPLMHYVEHCVREGRRPSGSANGRPLDAGPPALSAAPRPAPRHPAPQP